METETFWKIFAIALLSIILIGAGIYFGNKYLEKRDNKNYNAGLIDGSFIIIGKQMQSNSVYYITNETGNYSLGSWEITPIKLQDNSEIYCLKTWGEQK